MEKNRANVSFLQKELGFPASESSGGAGGGDKEEAQKTFEWLNTPPGNEEIREKQR